VANNALMYNKKGTPFHRVAARVKRESKNFLNLLEPWKLSHPPHTHPFIDGDRIRENDDNDSNDHHPAASEIPPPLGDFEPPLDVLDLLMSSDLIRDDLNMELDVDPVSTLLKYEFARVKPVPEDISTPQAQPARQSKKKTKRGRKADVERTKADKEAKARETAAAHVAQEDEGEEEVDEAVAIASVANEDNRMQEDLERQRRREHHTTLDESTGFRPPRTRGAKAAAAAFEAEAHGSTPISASSSISIPASAGPSRPPDSADDSANQRNSHWKRPSIAPMSQASIPRVVNDVDNRDSFNMFNAGWILRPDQKRGGRAPTEKSALPPPRKRQKTGLFAYFLPYF